MWKMGDVTPKKSSFECGSAPSSLPKPKFQPEAKCFSTKKVSFSRMSEQKKNRSSEFCRDRMISEFFAWNWHSKEKYFVSFTNDFHTHAFLVNSREIDFWNTFAQSNWFHGKIAHNILASDFCTNSLSWLSKMFYNVISYRRLM